MFENLTDKLGVVFKNLRGHGKLTERNIKDAMREVRRALLEADVNYRVAKSFIGDVEVECLGTRVMKSLTPGHQVVKIVNEKLVGLLGSTASELNIASAPPTIIMAVGLQGSGKTTFLGKLATYLKSTGKSPMMIAADIHRPAAIDQLEIIGKSAHAPVYSDRSEKEAWKIVKRGMKWAGEQNHDMILIDTAGRLHIDHDMMEEVRRVKEEVEPTEILFVADSMTGQDAVNVAREFNEQLEIHGIVLTKMDGDARGGAAISIKAVTGKPIKFVGVGEKLDALEEFHPDRMASRILGMGDVLTLIEKAEATIDEERARELEKKIVEQRGLTLDDFLDQLQQIKNMGSLDQLVDMIPGMSGNFQADEEQLKRSEAMIRSMTIQERHNPRIINGSRRMRIAKGSGTTVQDINRLLKQFSQMNKMVRQLTGTGKKRGKKFKRGLPFSF